MIKIFMALAKQPLIPLAKANLFIPLYPSAKANGNEIKNLWGNTPI
jgi:hypothetical protein